MSLYGQDCSGALAKEIINLPAAQPNYVWNKHLLKLSSLLQMYKGTLEHNKWPGHIHTHTHTHKNQS
jgi:hypothetical protein